MQLLEVRTQRCTRECHRRRFRCRELRRVAQALQSAVRPHVCDCLCALMNACRHAFLHLMHSGACREASSRTITAERDGSIPSLKRHGSNSASKDYCRMDIMPLVSQAHQHETEEPDNNRYIHDMSTACTGDLLLAHLCHSLINIGEHLEQGSDARLALRSQADRRPLALHSCESGRNCSGLAALLHGWIEGAACSESCSVPMGMSEHFGVSAEPTAAQPI